MENIFIYKEEKYRAAKQTQFSNVILLVIAVDEPSLPS